MKRFWLLMGLAAALPTAVAAAQTFTKSITVNGVATPGTIADLTVAGCTGTTVLTCTLTGAAGATSIPAGTVIGAIGVVMNPAGAAVPSTLALSVNDCTSATPPVCTASTKFQVSAAKLPSNLVVGPNALPINATGTTTFQAQLVANQ